MIDAQVAHAPRTVPPDASPILKGFLVLFIKPTALAVAGGYYRLRFVDHRLSSQQSLDFNGTVATAPINATEEPNAGADSASQAPKPASPILPS
jgi:hypothetical protein